MKLAAKLFLALVGGIVSTKAVGIALHRSNRRRRSTDFGPEELFI